MLALLPSFLLRKERTAAFLAVEEVRQSIISVLSPCLSAAFSSTCTSNGLSSGCGGACYELKVNQLDCWFAGLLYVPSFIMLLKSVWLRDFADFHSCMPSRGGTMEE
jgi:hypothetical protein